MIELNEKELNLALKAFTVDIQNINFITKSDLLSCLTKEQHDIAVANLEMSNHLCWGSSNRSIYTINEVISEINNDEIENIVSTYVSVLCKIHQKQITYVDMEN